MRVLRSAVLALLLTGIVGGAHAATPEEVIKQIQGGKYGYFEYPQSGVHMFEFKVAGNLYYTVDLKAHICYHIVSIQKGGEPVILNKIFVPCQNLKKGYPLIAPLITWND